MRVQSGGSAVTFELPLRKTFLTIFAGISIALTDSYLNTYKYPTLLTHSIGEKDSMLQQQPKKEKREATMPKVLLYLTCNKANKWEIAQKLNKSYSNIHSTIKQLLRQNLICVSHRKRSSKNPKIDVEYYTVTFQGLITALVQPESLKYADQIAEQQEKLLPLIFGKWQHFKNSGVDISSLQNALDWLFRMARRSYYDTANWVMRDFSTYVFNMTKLKERVRWLKAIHADPDLSKWALEEERSFLIYANTLKYTFRLIRQSKPDWDEALEELYRIASHSTDAYKH